MPETAPWWTTLDPAPPGFTTTALAKRQLLQGPVVVLVPALQELQAVLPDYATRMVGIALTPGSACSVQPLSSHTWHASIPLPLDPTAQALIRGWLHSVAQTDQAETAAGSAVSRNERATALLGYIQNDYQRLTHRLRQQVDELMHTKRALSDANEALEQRVAARTQALEETNTHLSQVVHELRQTQSELVHQEKLASLGSMVAGVAHELNTPIGNALTVASAWSFQAQQILQDVRTGMLKRSTLERFSQECMDMGDVVERNLRMAAEVIGHFKQLAVDQTSERRRVFLLQDIVADTLTALSPRLRQSHHRLELAVDPELQMDSYPGAISQVLNNLIINALIHAFENRPHGHMRLLGRQGSSSDSAELVFSDNGVGIAAADLKRVFDPFFTTRMGQGGSGLGMHLVYNLVTAVLGGKIRLESLPGVGTEVHIVLPLQAPYTSST
ncbi:MAG: sensor histidine kinase [Rhodoferax sp.]